jgi:hypothetical protein
VHCKLRGKGQRNRNRGANKQEESKERKRDKPKGLKFFNICNFLIRWFNEFCFTVLVGFTQNLLSSNLYGSRGLVLDLTKKKGTRGKLKTNEKRRKRRDESTIANKTKDLRKRTGERHEKINNEQ